MNQSSRGFGGDGGVSKCNARKRRRKDIKKLKEDMIEIGKELIKVVPKFQKELIKRYGD